MQWYGFTANEPTTQLKVVMQALKYELMARQVKEVGGLFQCALLNEKGVQRLGYSAPSVILEPREGRFIQRNTVTGDELPLMSIWEWAEERPKPGEFGTFEDPGLLEAVQRMHQGVDGTKPDHVGMQEHEEPGDS